ncbi:NAD(P)-dependent oxidoreductase [Candidatus Endoriftia persephone]|jgi:3-hydroxyisobutyrate dehydrogenase-like beta-hydroxyacid dehydrogenase|uniref:2-hydroxy-3-oxopropionate reductase n=3 Tax=Gammaproteobacteria TaxID=1236 RepID=G2FH23_9GAMM|nr:NAD(P)-dependent oxidoreductase [Candidatus Endoriftia persephone]EGV50277.1 2-hydroxy-3-oxopropionate reductase [endosymbiont of Riftia pachyptila (vent Ph05)]EGW53837.1 2-hydroxy-3-oxopropionate reductase [endosymbiont of Tevnia jerichonana (vent Tica)]USF87688.1 NAD(P)-dependent oxidoreductase [Candidatus Endoriftia persephone]
MKITLIGLGLMGKPIAQRLIQCGHELVAWNRSQVAYGQVQAKGIPVESDLTAAIAQGEAVLLTLSDAAAIRATLLQPSSLSGLAGKVVVQMGTIAPNQSREIASAVEAVGGHYLEAPVLGSIPEARSGNLIVMAGGDAEIYQQMLLLLRCLGKQVQRIGEVGQGAAMKLAMNQLIASLTSAFSLSLGLVRAEGIDVEQFMGLLRESALYAPTFDKKLAKMLSHDYANPNFPLKHLIKDVDLFSRVVDELGIDAQLPQTMLRVFGEAQAAGHGEDDYSSLYEAINPDFQASQDEGC